MNVKEESSNFEKSKLYHDVEQQLTVISMLARRIHFLELKYELSNEYKLKLNIALQSVNTSVNNALFVLHDYLDTESVKFGKLTVKEILEKIVQQYKTSYGTNERIYELYFDSEDFDLQSEKFVRIINNLLSNATKYCPKGKIIVKVTEDETYHKIVIEDNGYGISKEKLNLVFYKQANESFQQPSFGIGLNIVQDLVEKLNGTIEVTSIIGTSTCFIMKFKKEKILV